MTDVWAPHMGAVARALLGDPNTALSSKTEWRYGSHGSLSVDLAKGTWHDHEAGRGGGVLALVMREHGGSKAAAVKWLEDLGVLEAQRQEKARVVATYDYVDLAGEVIFQVVRFHPKTFRQRRPDPTSPDGWTWKVRGIAPIPFRLPEITEAIANGSPIFVVEGEKDALALSAIGIQATCNPGGAGKWPEHFSEHLAGADVIIIPDNDEAGRKHRDVVGSSLQSVARVRVLELPGLAEKGDVSDWLGEGYTADELWRLVETRARPWTEGPPASRFGAIRWVDLDQQGAPYEWVVKNVLPRCGFAMIYGASQAGKSFLSIDLAMAVARGVEWFGSQTLQGLVAYQAGEGGRGVVKRLKAYRQFHQLPLEDLPFLLLPDELNLFAGEDPTTQFIDEMKRWARFMGRPVEVVVIDTLHAASTGADENASRDMGAVIHNCKRIQAELNCAVLLIHHMNANGSKPRGHTSLYAACDCALEVSYDEDTKQRMVKFAKIKDGADEKRFAFKLHVEVLGQDEDGFDVTSCVVKPDAPETKKPALRGLSDRERAYLLTIQHMVRRHGVTAPRVLNVPANTLVVPVDQCRAEFAQTVVPGTSPEAAGVAFNRAHQELIARGFIHAFGGFVWLSAAGEKVR